MIPAVVMEEFCVNQQGDPGAVPRPKRGMGVLVAVVAGVLVGAGVVGLTWAFAGGSGDPAAGAEGDVATACSLVRRTGTLATGSELDFEQYGRWGAANALMMNVGRDHEQYRPLADALAKSATIVASTFKAEGAEFDAAVREAREFCAKH